MPKHLPPIWFSHLDQLPHPVPSGLRAWLVHAGSTTERLAQQGLAPWKAHWYQHSWRALQSEEATLLDAHNSRFAVAMVRQSILYTAKVPGMFARSVFPKTTLVHTLAALRTLGSNSLGPLLFSDPTLQRSAFDFAVLSPEHTDYASAIAPLKPAPLHLYARRSVLHWQGHPLLLYEVFYPQTGELV